MEQGSSSGCRVRSTFPTSASVYGLTPGPGVGLAGSVPQAIMPIMPIDRITEKVRCADMRAREDARPGHGESPRWCGKSVRRPVPFATRLWGGTEAACRCGPRPWRIRPPARRSGSTISAARAGNQRVQRDTPAGGSCSSAAPVLFRSRSRRRSSTCSPSRAIRRLTRGRRGGEGGIAHRGMLVASGRRCYRHGGPPAWRHRS